MAPLALFNEGVPAHFFHLMEVPTMRLPNIKVLLRWPSRKHIYCSIGPFQWGRGGGYQDTFHLMEVPTFFYMMEQFDSMGVLGHFSLCLYLCTMHLSLIWSLLWSMESQHRAKADVCFSKQCTQTEDGIPCSIAMTISMINAWYIGTTKMDITYSDGISNI